MKIKAQREKLMELLSNLVNIITDKETEIASCVKIIVTPTELTMIGTDLQIEMIAKTALDENEFISHGELCVNAKKFLGLVKALPVDSEITIEEVDGSCSIKHNKSKFKLVTQPKKKFPSIRSKNNKDSQIIKVSGNELNRLLNKTAFSMAINDVRFVLNGLLIDVENGLLKVITTDGHRLSVCSTEITEADYTSKAIIPKKSVREITRYSTGEDDIELKFNNESLELNFKNEKSKFQSELNLYICLVDGKFPDYQKIIPYGNDIIATANREELSKAINRVSILSNEKLRSVVFNFSNGEVLLRSRNPEQDEAVEFIHIEYDNIPMEINLNSQYVLEVLSSIDSEKVVIEIADPTRPMLIKNPDDPSQQYIIMPMRL